MQLSLETFQSQSSSYDASLKTIHLLHHLSKQYMCFIIISQNNDPAVNLKGGNESSDASKLLLRSMWAQNKGNKILGQQHREVKGHTCTHSSTTQCTSVPGSQTVFRTRASLVNTQLALNRKDQWFSFLAQCSCDVLAMCTNADTAERPILLNRGIAPGS